MANKRIDELISKAIIDANDLVFVGDPLTGWLYKATVADLQAGVTGGIGGSGTANFIPKFATANTIGNSTIFDNGTSVAIGTTTPNASFKFVVNGKVSFGLNGLYSGYNVYDNSITTPPTEVGAVYWDGVDGQLNVNLQNGVISHIGGDLPVLVKKDDNTGLTKGTVVYQKGSDGANTTVLLAQANAESTSSKTFGIIANTTSGGAKAYCVTFGYIRGIDTSSLTEGNTIYLSPTTAGGMTTTKPQAPNHLVTIGRCIRSHATQGIIFVSVQNGFELDELHDVKINTPIHNQALIFNSSDNTWRNRTIIKTDGYVPYFDQSSLFLDSPLYTNGTKVAIGTNSFIGTNLLSVQGGIYSEEHTINGNLLIHSNILSGNAFISRWNGTGWDVEQTFYSDHILFSKDIESTKFTKTGGTSAQFLMADGSTATTSSLSLLTGPGTQNYIAKFYDASGLMMYNSQLYDNGTNVGIGTTTPFKKFTVQGGAISVYSSSTNYGFIDTSNNSFSLTSANGFYFVANNIGTVASTYVDTTGKWGFGVGTPSYKVDVNGDINTNGIYRISGSPLSTTNIAEGTNLYFTSNRVLGQVLTGLNVALTGDVVAGDSLIVGISKLQNSVSNKEPIIAAGTTAQYWRGDKTWQTLPIYVLPIASTTVLGGIKVGNNLSINATTGVLDATYSYTLPIASATVLGGVKQGSGTTIDANGVISVSTNYQPLNANLTSLAGLTYVSGTYFVKMTGANTFALDNNAYYLASNPSSFISLASLTGAISNITTTNLSPFYALKTDSNGKIVTSITTDLELGYLSGVSSNVQSQLDGKQATIIAGTTAQYYRGDKTWQTLNTDAVPESAIPTNKYYTDARVSAYLVGAISTVLTTNLTASRALISNASGKIAVSAVTDTELSYVSGVTSSIQTQLNGKQSALTNPITGTGTTYYLPKFTGSTTLGNSLIYDNGTNVGIGLTTPALKLDVLSTSQWDGIRVYNTTASQGADIRVGNDTNNNLGFLRVGGSTSGGNNQNTLMLGTGGGYTIHIAPNGTPAITALNGGNVGIGTSSPSYKLEVSGTGYFSGLLNVMGYFSTYSDSTTLGSLGFNRNVSNGAIYNSSYAAFQMQNSSGLFNIFGFNGAGTSLGQLLALTTTGNLGLGVTPSAWSNMVAFELGGYGSAITAWNSNRNTYVLSNAYYNAGFKYKTLGSAAYYNISGENSSHSWYVAGSGNADAAIAFTQAMTLDASGRLSVPYSYISSSGWQSNGTTFTTAAAIYNGIYGISADTIGFATQAAERMRVNANGTISIGNTNNTYKLDVSGQGKFSDNTQGLIIGAYTNGGGYGAIYASTVTPGASNYSLALSSTTTYVNAPNNGNLLLASGGNEYFRLNGTTGNVSIGNNNNTYKLDVSGTGIFRSNELTLNGSSYPVIGVVATSTFPILALLNNAQSAQWNIELGRTTSGNLEFYNGGTKIAFTSTGAATFSSSVTAGSFVSNDATYGSLVFNGGTSNGVVGSFGTNLRLINFTASGTTTVQGNGDININTQGGYNILFGTSALERVRITSTGNVGIGTTSPSQKLDVAGKINFSAFETDADIFGLYASSTGTTISSYTGYSLVLRTNTTERMRITSGGAVGIATNNPTGIFQVAGSGNIFFGDAPSNTNYKFNVKGFSGNFISFWTPTISGANNNGIMSHSGAGLTALTPMGYNASTHVFNGEVTGGGTMQVSGDVNISGTFKVNGTAIGTGGGGVSGSGTAGYVPLWSAGTSLTNSNIISYPSSSEIDFAAKNIYMYRNDGVLEIKYQSSATYTSGAILNMNMIATDAINNRTTPGSGGGFKFDSTGRVMFYGDSSSGGGNYALAIVSGLTSNANYHTTLTTLTGNNAYINHIVGDNYSKIQMGVSGSYDTFIGSLTSYTTNSNLVLGANRFGTGMYSTLVIKWNTIALPYIPTASTGLSSGDVYRDALGYVRIV